MAIDHDTTRITENLGHVKPTVMASVPRIFEKVYAKVVAGGLETPGLKGKLFKWTVGLNDSTRSSWSRTSRSPSACRCSSGWPRSWCSRRSTSASTALFGGRLRFFISGGAPLPKKMAYFFDNAGIVILEGYGLTETSAASCLNRPT
jgi:long-chain acyl-CoA synthetase